MANQRPIRRGKIPFFRRSRKKRPTRWLGYTQEANGDGNIAALTLPYAGDVEAPILVVVDGDQDVVPWADEQEITIDRVVGSLTTLFHNQLTDPPVSIALLNPPMARYGLLVVENFDTADPPLINLWDLDAYEQYEWMWLRDVIREESTTSVLQDGGDTVQYNMTQTQIDLRVRRKLGPKDQLLLYGSVGRPDAPSQSGYMFFGYSIPALRVIAMSR